ncbi:hypothetical protein EDP1_3987 [Pseudomonas putida S610]|nr:hypothetical protein EDP1_3987 [Pseudomonas putida S610]
MINTMAYTSNIDHVLPHCVANRCWIVVRIYPFDASRHVQRLINGRQIHGMAALHCHIEAIAEKHRDLNAAR